MKGNGNGFKLPRVPFMSAIRRSFTGASRKPIEYHGESIVDVINDVNKQVGKFGNKFSTTYLRKRSPP
jgi:hypothetical protein